MKVQRLIARLLPLLLAAGCAHVPTPQEQMALLQSTKHITLISGGTKKDDGTWVPNRLTVDSPEQVQKFVAAITLKPAERSCCCLYCRSAVFSTDHGDVHLMIGPHRLFVSYAKNRDRMYYMPREFYTLFENAYGREPVEYKSSQPSSGANAASPRRTP